MRALQKYPSVPNISQMMPYIEAGYGVIPVRPFGKEPCDKDWPRKSFDPFDVIKRATRGNNVGILLTAIDLVLDVDPRNFKDGHDSLAAFALKCGLRLAELPCVETGGGGLHFYMKKPPGMAIVGALKGYPGLEFKTVGQQVIAAGSLHPNGRPYVWSKDGYHISKVAMAPDSLLALIEKKPTPPPATTAAGSMTEEELATFLGQLDPMDFTDHEKWLELAMASHHATGGSGEQAFIDWSIGDPDYAEHAETIAGRWRSFKADTTGSRITVRSLFKIAAEQGVSPPASAAEDDFPDFAAASTAADIFDAWAFIIGAGQFVRRSDLVMWAPDQWKTAHAHHYPDGDILNAVWKGKVSVRRFERLVYVPGASEFPEGIDGQTYNAWRPSGTEPRDGDASWFVDHIAHLIPEEPERGHVLDFLAHLVQRPADKIHFAMLICGDQGTGKSLIGEVMSRVIGAGNVSRPSNSEVLGDWTGWQRFVQLAVIEELMSGGNKDLANRLKTVITDSTIRVNEKYAKPYSLDNRLNLICFTNHRNALPIEPSDRRWFVLFSTAKPRDSAYYAAFAAKMNSDAVADVAGWLMRRDISAFEPKGRAPATAAKEEMRRLSMPEIETTLMEMWEDSAAPFDFDLVTVAEIKEALEGRLLNRSGNHGQAVTEFLKSIGATKSTRNTSNTGPAAALSKVRLWVLRNHQKWESAGPTERVRAYQAHHDAALRGEDTGEL